MSKEDLIKLFDDFVMRNAKAACSDAQFKSLDKLIGLKFRFNEDHKLLLPGVALLILSHRNNLCDIMPRRLNQLEVDDFNKLIHLCNAEI